MVANLNHVHVLVPRDAVSPLGLGEDWLPRPFVDVDISGEGYNEEIPQFLGFLEQFVVPWVE